MWVAYILTKHLFSHSLGFQLFNEINTFTKLEMEKPLFWTKFKLAYVSYE